MSARTSRRVVWSLTAAALLGVGGAGVQAASDAQTAAFVRTTPAQMLVTGQGMTLYVYAPDKKDKSVCYGECAEYWPPLIVPQGAAAPATLPGIKGTFGVTVRTNGKRQLTYDGAPLYTFVKDKKPGQMTGQGLDVVGGYWWVVVAPQEPATAAGASSSSPSAPAPTATPSSGGYYSGTGGADRDRGDDHHRGRGDRATPPSGSYYNGGEHGGHGGHDGDG